MKITYLEPIVAYFQRTVWGPGARALDLGPGPVPMGPSPVPMGPWALGSWAHEPWAHEPMGKRLN